MTHRVVFEIEVDDCETPLEAAKKVQEWIQEKGKNWQYYVQNVFTDEVTSVDLTEDDDEAELPVDKYESLIK